MTTVIRTITRAKIAIKFWLFKKIMKSYCKELDQWELYSTTTKYGRIYITLARIPIGQAHYDNYVEL